MIKNLVFKGGGVLGQAYVGAMLALEELGLLKNLKGVAGTSAGSLMAGLIAMGYTPIEIKTVMEMTDFSTFEDGFNPFRFFTSYGIYKGDVALQWIRQRLENKGFSKDATFADLHERGCIDLNVLVSNISIHTVQRCCYANTPNTKVAEAMRGSMSIPGIYKAWQFTSGELVEMWFVDGGMVDNYPIQSFDATCAPNETLGLFLYDVHDLHVPPPFGSNSPMKYIRNLFSTLMASQDIAFMQSPNDNARTLIIDTLGVSAINFKIDTACKDSLEKSGYDTVKLKSFKLLNGTALG